jgi:hypothetical protein
MASRFISLQISDLDERMIKRLMSEDMLFNRSEFIRRLIHQEWARRYSQPNPAISVADAMAAGSEIEIKDQHI